MKIIYDNENNFGDEKNVPKGSFQSQDVDIAQDNFKKKKQSQKKEPHSGVQQSTDSAATHNKPSENTPPQGVVPQNTVPPQQPYGIPYGAPVTLTQEQYNYMMAQFAAMQNPQTAPDGNAHPTAAPYAQYPQYPPYPGYPPYPQYPQYPQTPTQPIVQNQPQNDAPNPGTRVLYQSEDFDKPEKEEKSKVWKAPDPVYKKEFSADIDEETVEMNTSSKKKSQSSFSVDETQMSMFELDTRTLKTSPQQIKKKPAGEPQQKKRELTAEEKFFRAKEDPKSDESEKKKLPTSEIIRRVILAVSLVAIVVASGMLLNEYRLSEQNDNVMEEVSDLIITEEEKTTNKKEDKEEEKTTERELTPEEQWAKLKSEYPNVLFPLNLQLKYAKLYAVNQDFVGYLSADGVGLNLPVVQAEDDKKYLEKNFYKQSTKYGCPFVTHLNNITPLDQNTVIFGHHMNNGTIFGALDKYKTIDGFKKAPLITFNTLYHDYSWKVIAAFVTNAYEKDDNGYIFRYYFTQLSTFENFSAYLSELSQRSLYDTGVDVLPTDKILTLSTCSHEFTDARFVVVARLVRPGESTNVDVSRATVNPNPRYPQAWYDKKGKKNPYKNAFQWEVS